MSSPPPPVRRKTTTPTPPTNNKRCRRGHNRNRKETTPSLGYKIPDELTREILHRVSAKSLMRFKAVSKPWRELVNHDKTFIEKHKEVRAYLGNAGADIFGSRNFVLDVQPNVPLPLSSHPPQSHVYFIGCLDGLLCLYYSSRDVFVWNPAIRDCLRLPPPAVAEEEALGCCFAFGFDTRARGYKVVRVWLTVDDRRGFCNKVEVCGLGGVWRQIDPPELCIECYGEHPVCLRGKCYFKSRARNIYMKDEPLIVMDLSYETFELVPLPFQRPSAKPPTDGGWYTVIQLVDSVGLVSYVDTTRNPSSIDIWMLDDSSSNGGSVSWSKYATVETSSPNFRVLRVTHEGDIHFQDCESGLAFAQDIRTGEVESLGKRVRSSRHTFVYSDSLVSPRGEHR